MPAAPGDAGAGVPEPALVPDAVVAATPGGTAQVRVVELDARSVVVGFTGFVVLLAVASVALSSSMTVLVAVGVLLAFALDPVVDAIQHRLNMRRGYAVALLCGAGFAAIVGAIAAFGASTVEQAQSFQDDLPRVLGDLGKLPLIGQTLLDNHVPDNISSWAAGLPKQLAGNTSQITNVAETITGVLFSALGIGLVTVSLLVDGPWLVDGARRLIPTPRRERADRLGRILGIVIGRYFAGSLLLAVLQALQVLVTGLILGVPLSPLLAVWAGIWNLVPQIGGAIGGIVFVAVAFTQGATTGLIAALVFVVYLTFANNVLLPVILGRAVDISPLTTMVATIAGFSVGGVIGAMLAVPLLGAGKAVYRELRPGPLVKVEGVVAPAAPGRVRRTYARVRRRRPPGDGAATG